METNFIVCRMSYKNKKKFVRVAGSKDGFDIQNFIIAGSNSLEFDIEKFSHFEDQKNFEISTDDFNEVILLLVQTSYFELNIVLHCGKYRFETGFSCTKSVTKFVTI